MDLKEFKERFSHELAHGLDHAEWYELEIKWLIAQAEKVGRYEKENQLLYGRLNNIIALANKKIGE